MIPRYSRPEMTAIWSPETKFRIWFEIEAHAAEAMAELGTIPKDAARKIWEKGKSAKFDVARIDAIEAEVKHDVIAFLTHLSEIIGPEARFVHSGMTSSDVLDTCLSVQLVRAADILVKGLERVLEAEEYFSEKQKGSSAMPHKRNPVLSENVTGLARMIRSYALPAMENVALWHERDISHSSVERMIGPDATITLDFALARLASIIDRLIVYPAAMQKNLDRLGGLIHSQRVLIALTQKGVPREDAYRLVQRNAMKVWGGESDFLSLLKADKDVRAKLTDKELEANFNLDHHFRHVDIIFKRVFGSA
jgi:adenylosuccinate lyase